MCASDQMVRWPDEGKKSNMNMLGALRPLSFAFFLSAIDPNNVLFR
jgi:hypothetical protein